MPRLTACYSDRASRLPPTAANDAPMSAVDHIIGLAVIATREPAGSSGERNTLTAPTEGLKILELARRLRRPRRRGNMSLEQIARALSLR